MANNIVSFNLTKRQHRNMDNLENFIRENRADFDREVPDLAVWGKIAESLPPVAVPATRTVRMQWWKRAVAAVLLLAIGASLGILVVSGSGKDRIESLADISPEYAETERYFNQSVENKKAKLAAYDRITDVESDLAQIDEVLAELTAELNKAPDTNREQIIDAMIRNYRAKMEILDVVLRKVEDADSQKNIESNDISI